LTSILHLLCQSKAEERDEAQGKEKRYDTDGCVFDEQAAHTDGEGQGEHCI
jgi:hypothetical protein